MKTYPIAGPDRLDPFWFNKVRYSQHAARVSADGTVTVEGVALRLLGEVPAPGTAVQAWLSGSGHFVCATVEDIEREALARSDVAATEAERRRRQLNAWRADAEAFNARIGLPVKWDVGIKDVLSGLSATSRGDGRSKATVEHILLLGALKAGRLTREEGDFLCTSARATNGKAWSGKPVERCHDGDGHPYQPKVTCRACLALAERWITGEREGQRS